MLELKEIRKQYGEGDSVINALNGVSLKFRENEFVSILGASGCGKTTLLNIVGGLDRYTSGDLIINGRSTKDFEDGDWDAYRNHSIGFVFQSYNLIPHQTVLSNVELALTLSGVSKAERRQRATEALQKVGLGDQLHKKPNQMSGGQMQRVAIARALVNNPDILLADEPTGALDTATSVQIMELLKEVAREKLVIMVTHNPDLANEYSTRIVRLSDGEVVDDTNPYDGAEFTVIDVPEALTKKQKKESKAKSKKKSMSFATAVSLSFNNLLTKKARTILTSFAGSIGIIGIALIMSVSNGVNAYITGIEHSTMASYPIQIQRSTMDSTTLLTGMMEAMAPKERPEGEEKVYSNDIMVSMMNAITSGITENNMSKFKAFIEDESNIDEYTTDIKYTYKANLNTYKVITDENGEPVDYKENLKGLTDLMVELGMMSESNSGNMSSTMMDTMGGQAWSELVGDEEYISSQYEIIDGHLPQNDNQVVLIVDRDKQVTDYILYTIGIRDVSELKDFLKLASDGDPDTNLGISPTEYTFDEIYGHKFRVLLDSDNYKLSSNGTRIVERTEAEKKLLLNDATELEIVGIVCPAEDSVTSSTIGSIGYTAGLMPSLIERVNDSDVVKAQLENKDTDMFTGAPFGGYTESDIPMLREMMKLNSELIEYAQANGITVDLVVGGMTDEQILAMVNSETATYEGNLEKLGYVDMSDPETILLYPKDFESKDTISSIISEYNDNQIEADKISYTDTVAMLMSSVTTIVNAISYVLIAFVAISLVVSSIMIGIITYISVLERTKEIGVLRSIGASKKDISRVFNAETLIVGFCAGAIGIICTLLFNIIINIILFSLTEIAALKASLPILAAVILVLISMFLTFIAGLIPSRLAAKKDPVEALRTE